MFKKILIGAAVMVILTTKSEPLALFVLDLLLGWFALWLVIQTEKRDM